MMGQMMGQIYLLIILELVYTIIQFYQNKLLYLRCNNLYYRYICSCPSGTTHQRQVVLISENTRVSKESSS